MGRRPLLMGLVLVGAALLDLPVVGMPVRGRRLGVVSVVSTLVILGSEAAVMVAAVRVSFCTVPIAAASPAPSVPAKTATPATVVTEAASTSATASIAAKGATWTVIAAATAAIGPFKTATSPATTTATTSERAWKE